MLNILFLKILLTFMLFMYLNTAIFIVKLNDIIYNETEWDRTGIYTTYLIE